MFLKVSVEVVSFWMHLEGLEDQMNVVCRAAARESSHSGGMD